jgi:hypothetical protein
MIDLATASNAPRELPLDGATYRARTLTLNQLGELLAWLEARAGGDAPPPFASEAAQVALATTEGLAVVLHLSLSSCHPGLTRDAARSLAATLNPAGADRLFAVAFRRRPNRKAPAPGRGKDLTEVDWGMIWEALSQHEAAAYAGCGDVTLDQMENHLQKGESPDSDSLTMAEVQAMWEASRREEESPPARDPDAVLLPGERVVSAEVPTDDG